MKVKNAVFTSYIMYLTNDDTKRVLNDPFKPPKSYISHFTSFFIESDFLIKILISYNEILWFFEGY